MTRPRTEEEQVIRDWLAGMLSPSGAPLPPSRRRSQPIPRRQVTAVVATLVELLDEARSELARVELESGRARFAPPAEADLALILDDPTNPPILQMEIDR